VRREGRSRAFGATAYIAGKRPLGESLDAAHRGRAARDLRRAYCRHGSRVLSPLWAPRREVINGILRDVSIPCACVCECQSAALESNDQTSPRECPLLMVAKTLDRLLSTLERFRAKWVPVRVKKRMKTRD
jgi:hypothetical protein